MKRQREAETRQSSWLETWVWVLTWKTRKIFEQPISKIIQFFEHFNLFLTFKKTFLNI
jgi:hypothetical protein